jgi:hypothetical protein
MTQLTSENETLSVDREGLSEETITLKTRLPRLRLLTTRLLLLTTLFALVTLNMFLVTSRWHASPLRIVISLAMLLIVPGVIGVNLVIKAPPLLHQYLLLGPALSIALNLLLAFVLNITVGVTDHAIAIVWLGVTVGFLYRAKMSKQGCADALPSIKSSSMDNADIRSVDAILVAISSFLLACYFSFQQVANLFLFQTLLPVSQASTHLNLAVGIEAKGYPLLFFYLLRGSGVDVMTFPYLPLGLPILGLTLLGITFALTRSRRYSLLGTFIFLFNGGIASAFYSVFAYVWSLTLYFAFLGLLLTQDISGQNRNLLLGSILFTTMTIHYTMIGWEIIALIIVWSASLLLSKTRLASRFHVGTTILIGFTILGVFVLSYFRLLTSYLPNIIQISNLENALLRNLRLLSSYMFGSTGIYATAYSSLYGLSRVLWIGAIGGSICLFTFMIPHNKGGELIENVVYQVGPLRSVEALLLVFVATLVIDSVVYGLLGNFSIKYLLFVGPLMFSVAYGDKPVFHHSGKREDGG